jgi:protein ImuB
VLRLALPEESAAAFARGFALRLERLPLPAPVRRCLLQSGPLLERAAASGRLWQPGEQGGGAAEQLPAFLEPLRARLGDAAVQGISLQPGHRPERLSCPVPPASSRARSSSLPPWAPGLRPLWLLRRPRPLEQGGDGSGHPVESGRRLSLVAGPERIETGWWDGGDVSRDYYVAADADGARLWIYRERDGRGGWFVHGYFG